MQTASIQPSAASQPHIIDTMFRKSTILWLICWLTLAALSFAYQPYLSFGYHYTVLSFYALPGANSLSNPVPNQRFIDTWGAPRSGGRKHEGVDIFAPRNTPVIAAFDALVYDIGDNALGGRSVWLMGPGGAFHYYTHLEAYGSIHTRQFIPKGTVIGYVGNSGNAKTTPTHLHYGIYINGKAVNPYPLLQKNS